MKKNVSELQKKTIIQLEKESLVVREVIAKLRLEVKVNPPKNTNLLRKKRKELARMLTVLTEKKDKELNNKLVS